MPEPMIPTQPGYYWATWRHPSPSPEELEVAVVEVYRSRAGVHLGVYRPGDDRDYKLADYRFLSGPLSPPEVPR